MTLIEVRNRLRDLCDEAGSITKWSSENKLPFGYVAAVIRGDKLPGKKILEAIGLKKVYTFKKITPDYRN